MWMICKKEWSQFFSSLTGYVALVVFLLLNGLMFFVFPNTSLLNFGYASLDGFFSLAPWILLFLIPTITMRSLADEYKAGTFELLKTLPLTSPQIVWGKFFGALLIVLLALIPTTIYAFSLQRLSAAGGIDVGATIGSYIGLFLLGAVFTAVGLCASSFTNNTIVAFISGAFVCLILYAGFDALSQLPVFSNGLDYYVQMLGINFHYKSISKGVVDIRDVIYFLAIILFFMLLTKQNIEKR
ncbi:ABC transporter permease subunit [Parafilimonas terrae]|uniref:Protein involved in gliding motility GldF n=1 Tax=Parafilimonas terrae TaxID=1465490 RepID=A0A1I5XKE1_9BACT|nr:ABC transporter permease subunit [Parafilimonas terrae]SFQ32390.1 protein involved in gliding motility GldF [Parafilimonas terrae]